MTLTLRVPIANSQRSCTRWNQLAGNGLKSPIDLPSDKCTGVATTRGPSCCDECTPSTSSHVRAAVGFVGCWQRFRIRTRSSACCGRWGLPWHAPELAVARAPPEIWG
ncbi:MAG: hypothetical protein ACJAYX_003915 [Planctomycetota bacterium]|jgi:hypothetical protein